MNEYELLYIVSSAFTDEELSAIEALVGGMLTKVGAAATHTERLGKFRLTYPIKRQSHGHYVLVRFQAEPSAMAALNDLLRLSPDRVLRHLILRADEVGDDKYQFIQFQEVNVEDRSRRPRGGKGEKDEKSKEGKPEDVIAQKEGVAALEETHPQAASVVVEEDLDKKIEEALEEKA